MKWWWIKHGMLSKFVPERISIFKSLVLILLIFGLSLSGCSSKATSQDVISFSKNLQPAKTFSQNFSRKISETSPPKTIQELGGILDIYQPRVKIISPQADEVVAGSEVEVRLDIKDLPIFKDSKLGLGSHLNVILDNQPLQEIYDTNQPLKLSEVSPGTHTLRVFASRPWNESFKNEGAYAQTTFHIYAKSEDNNPDEDLPLLTYSSPQGDYGAEPILLDFYLTNAPLHLLNQDSDNKIGDWRIRCTINGESFLLDSWQSLYLKGFKTGTNWIKLEFIDGQGNTIKNVFNSTLKTINYQPKGKDTLSRIVRGELSAEQVRSIVDSEYVSTTPVSEPEFESETELKPEIEPEVKSTVEREKEIEPEVNKETRITEEANPTLEKTKSTENKNAEKLEENLSEEKKEKEILEKTEKNDSSGRFLKRFQISKENQDTVEAEQNFNLSPVPEKIDTLQPKEKSEAEIKLNPETLNLEQSDPKTKPAEDIPQTITKQTSQEIEKPDKPKADLEDIPQTENQPKLPNLGKYFKRRDSVSKSDAKSDTKSETKEVDPSLVNPVIQVPGVEQKEEVTPSDNNEARQISTPQMNTEPVPEIEVDKPSTKKDFEIKDFGKYFKLNKETSPDKTPETEVEIEPTPQLPPTLPEIVEPPVIQPEIK
ncbi:MAG: hypothetical protein AAF208_04525 [Cyanobacteria bacterium P01_A01_bin.45]